MMTVPPDSKDSVARLSLTDDGERLRALFAPWPVITCEAVLPATPPSLPQEEWEPIAQAVTRRQVEFATGRCCARRALGRLGITGFVLRNDPQRAPQWPVGIVGSLTHTGPVPGGFCAVALGRSEELMAVGIDAEGSEGLPEHLTGSVLTDGERAMVARLAPTDEVERRRLAKIIFSAKEAVYKAQFPLTRRWLDFHDVNIELNLESDGFTASLVTDAIVEPMVMPVRGRFSRKGPWVITALGVPYPALR